jgi:hypothetical protein
MITVKHDEPSAPVKLCEQLKDIGMHQRYLGAIFVFSQFVTVAAFDIDITRVVIGLPRRVAAFLFFAKSSPRLPTPRWQSLMRTIFARSSNRNLGDASYALSILLL